MPNNNSSTNSPALMLAALLAVLAVALMLMYRPCGGAGGYREAYQAIPPGAKQAERRANRILNGYMDV